MEKVEFTINEGVLNCTFHGKMTTAVCDEVIAELQENFKKEISAIEYNISDVDYISSSFIRLCVMAIKKVGKDQFSLANVSPKIKEVFTLVGLSDIT